MSNASDFLIENGVLIKYVGPGGDVVIPDGVVQIGRKAFIDLNAVTSVTCPVSVTTIESESFYQCGALTAAELPGVEEIGASAFYGCAKLTNLTLSDGLRIIGNIAFRGCCALSNVVLPESTEYIGWGAFERCAITKIVVPRNVKVLQHQAFSGCSDITVYDTLDPDAGDCNEKIDFLNGNPNSELGFVGIGPARARWDCVLNHQWIDHVITVRSAETDTVKYKVHMAADPGQRDYQCLLASAWGHHATFSFEALDVFFSKIKKKKPQVALSRLTYRTALSPEMEEKYVKYICKMAKDVIVYCIDNHDMDALRLCAQIGAVKENNIEELLSYATQKGCAEAAAFLLDYKIKHLVTEVPKQSLRASVPTPKKPASDDKVWTVIKQSDGSGLISKYTGEDTEIEFPTEVAGVKIRGTATRRGTTPDNYKKITSVKIPEGYVVIGNKTFEGCEALINVELASTIQKIGHETFAGCTALETIVLPPLLMGIDAFMTDGGKCAFRDCSALKDIFVTNPDMYISDKDVFKGCQGYKIYATENAKVFQFAQGKYSNMMTTDDIKRIAKLYYGIPRKRTVVCTETSEDLPSIGEILRLEVRTVTKEIRGNQFSTIEFHAVNNQGVAFGSPMMTQFDLFNGEDFREDCALGVFVEYLTAQVTSKPRKYKKYKCFDVEIKAED